MNAVIKKYITHVVWLTFFLFCPVINGATNQVNELEEDVKIGTTVIGNAEFPKVEYKHPWKTVQVDTVMLESMQKTKAAIALHFISRGVVQRKLKIYKNIRMSSQDK